MIPSTNLAGVQPTIWVGDLEALDLIPHKRVGRAAEASLREVKALDRAGWFRRYFLGQRTVTRKVKIDLTKLARISQEIPGRTSPPEILGRTVNEAEISQMILTAIKERALAKAIPPALAHFVDCYDKFPSDARPGEYVQLTMLQTNSDGSRETKPFYLRLADIERFLGGPVAYDSDVRQLIIDHLKQLPNVKDGREPLVLAAGNVEDLEAEDFQERRKKLALPENLLKGIDYDVEDDVEAVIIDVLVDHGNGMNELVQRKVGLEQLADYLMLDMNAVREILKHVGVEELVIRTTLIPQSHLQEFAEGAGWDDNQARAAAIISDIILDRVQVTGDLLNDFGTALRRPLSYENGVLTIGEPKPLGVGAYGIVHEERVETLGTADPLTGKHRFYGVVADKRQEPGWWVNDEVRIGLELNGLPYVAKTMFLRHSDGQSIAVSAAEPCNGGVLGAENPNFKDLPLAAKFRVLSQILQGLNGIHERGYVHCDVKGANIALTKVDEGFQPRIIDFGLTAKIGVSNKQERVTCIYRSPEYHKKALTTITPAIDAFSAGVVALEVFLGIIPNWFSGWDKPGLGERIQGEIPLLMKQIDKRKDIPRPIRDGIKLLIDRNSTKRNIPKAIQLIEQGIRFL